MSPARSKPIGHKTGYVAVGLCAALGAWLLFGPAVPWLWRTWLVHPYYSHGVLIPIVCLALAWRVRHDFDADRGSLAGLGPLAAGAAVAAIALPREAMPLVVAGGVVAGLGTAWLLGGRRLARGLVFPAALVLVAIPMPLAERLAPPLAGVVAAQAAAAAGAIGIPVTLAGAQLTVGDGAFVVGAPCSGMRSIIALATLAFLAAGLLEGGSRLRWALVVLAVPLAVAANWLRIMGLIVVANIRGAEAGLAVFDGPLAPVLFLGAAAVLAAAFGRLQA